MSNISMEHESSASSPMTNQQERKWSTNDKANLQALKKIMFTGTRYVDKALLRQLNMWEPFLALFKNMGLESLLYTYDGTYKTTSQQLIASLGLNFDNPDSVIAREGHASFIVDGKFNSVSLCQMHAGAGDDTPIHICGAIHLLMYCLGVQCKREPTAERPLCIDLLHLLKSDFIARYYTSSAGTQYEYHFTNNGGRRLVIALDDPELTKLEIEDGLDFHPVTYTAPRARLPSPTPAAASPSSSTESNPSENSEFLPSDQS